MGPQEAVSTAWGKMQGMLDRLIVMLPNIVLAVIVFVIFYFAATAIKSLVKRVTRRHRLARSLGLVLGWLSQGTIILVGLFVALSIVIPSFKAGDLVQLLGISGVAIGFPFRDILQNFLAGILILLTEPFQIDDQIVFKNFEGTSTTKPKRQMAFALVSVKDGLRGKNRCLSLVALEVPLENLRKCDRNEMAMAAIT